MEQIDSAENWGDWLVDQLVEHIQETGESWMTGECGDFEVIVRRKGMSPAEKVAMEERFN